jgi:hypothetical protein
MKIKLKDMTYSQWLAHNARLRKKQTIDKDSNHGARQRFIDANREKKKIYRRSTARLIARMANPLLTKFCGGYIQKAKQRIIIKTSIDTEVIMQRTKRNGFWTPINKGFNDLSMEQIETEFNEIFNGLSYMFKEREKFKEDFYIPLNHKIKSSIKSITFQPLGEKAITQNFKSHKPIIDNSVKANGTQIEFDSNKLDLITNDYEKENDKIEIVKDDYGTYKKNIISKGKTKIKKDLPNAKSFNSINPDGTLKKTKTIYQSKRRFL